MHIPDVPILRRLAVVCGGTGGHFFPGLSVARLLRERGGEPLLVLAGKRAAAQAAAAAAFGVPSRAVQAAMLPRSPLAAPAFLAILARGAVESFRLLSEFKPHAVLAMGSFNSVPTAFACSLRRVPLALHDGNARIGKANRFLSRFARVLMTAFPPVNASQTHCPVECLGMPLRPELQAAPDRTAALAQIAAMGAKGFDQSRRTVVVFGGSQGAARVNAAAPAALRSLEGLPLQVIHLAGPGNAPAVKEAYNGASFPWLALDATDRMAPLYSMANLVVCRSGGSTVAELAFFGLPSILVPYPDAAEGHQDDNARHLRQAAAADILPDAECSPDALAALIRAWLDSPARMAEAAARAKALSRPSATADILARVAEAAGMAPPPSGPAATTGLARAQ